MEESNAANGTTMPVESQTKPTTKPADKREKITLEEWHKRAVDGLNDQETPFPRVW